MGDVSMKRKKMQDRGGSRKYSLLWCMVGFSLVAWLMILLQPSGAFAATHFIYGDEWYYYYQVPRDPGDPMHASYPYENIQVYPVRLQSSQQTEWQIESVAVGEDVYSDGIDYYIPEWAPAAVVTLKSTDGIRVLVGQQPNIVSPVSYSIEGNITTLVCQVTGGGGSVEVTINSDIVRAAPDNRGAVQALESDNRWYYAPEGLVFSIMPAISIDAVPTDCEIVSEDWYGPGRQNEIGGSYSAYAYFIPGEIKARVEGDYLIALEDITPDDGYPYELYVEEDKKAFTLIADGSGMSNLVIYGLDLRPAVTLTFPASDIYYLVDEYEREFTEVTIPAGTNFFFYLRTNWRYYIENYSLAFPTYEITGATEPVELFFEGDKTMITNDYTGTDATIIINVDMAGLSRRYGIIPREGAGYMLAPAVGGSDTGTYTIYANLMVDAGYSNSTPQLSAAGCTIRLGEPYPNDDGGINYFCIFTRTDQSPFTEDIAVTVSGIVPNGGGGGGGGGGGDSAAPPPVIPVPPAVRVENKLDQAKVSSDTILWPLNTVEESGVSTTVITDQELAALLELARRHAGDTANLEGDGLKEGIILIEDMNETSDNQSYVLLLTDQQFQSLAAEGWDRLTLQTPAGSFSLYDAAISEASGESGGDRGGVHFEISRLEHQGRPGVDATLTVDSSQVTFFELPYGVRLFIPYTPAAGEDVQALAVEYIHADGTVELVTECSYDSDLGGLILFTTHLSKFGVVYRPAVFEDVGPSHWANPYVTFLAARGIVGGYQGGKYLPDEPATRAEFISMATKALSAVKLPARPVQVYSDVPSTNFMAGAANWLYYNNLAGMISESGRLLPNEAITREDMAALLNNIASGVGLRIRSKGLDSDYTDTDLIASYARQAVQRLRAAGILEMAQNYKFNPKAPLNRGEMAQIMAMLLNNL